MGESYFLAVDVGTSRVGAATARLSADGSISAASFPLGRRSDSVATVVFVAEDGELLFGDVAERRGVTQPERLIREFKRSIGDEVPLMVGGQSIRAEQLYARTVASVIEIVTEREGVQPEAVILTHPAMWGPHRIGLVRAALDAIGVGAVEFITEPEAAARQYEAARALDDGQTLAVYDLGGGTFDCVILRKQDDAFELMSAPIGLDNLGGADFDDAVLRHVLHAADVPADVLADASPDARIALSQLRRECVDAKEALSFDSDVVVPVLLTAGRSSVRLTRAEFEDMIDGSVEQTIDALEDALDAADVTPEQLESVLLIGGSSRIPLVTQRLSERLDRPTAIDADPKSSIALGAARTALIRLTDRQIGVSTDLALLDASAASAGELELIPATQAPALAAPVGPVAGRSTPSARHILAVSGGAIVVAAAIVFGSTMTAGTGIGDFFAPSASDSKTTDSGTDADVAPEEEIVAPVTDTAPVADTPKQQQAQPKANNPGPRRGAKQAPPPTKPADAAAAPKPTKGAKPTPPPSANPGTQSGNTDGGSSTDGSSSDGTSTDGTSTDGTSTDGTSTDGTSTDGTSTDGTSTDGTSTDGTSTDGTSTDGTSTDGTSVDATSLDADATVTEPPVEPVPAATPDVDAPA